MPINIYIGRRLNIDHLLLSFLFLNSPIETHGTEKECGDDTLYIISNLYISILYRERKTCNVEICINMCWWGRQKRNKRFDLNKYIKAARAILSADYNNNNNNGNPIYI